MMTKYFAIVLFVCISITAVAADTNQDDDQVKYFNRDYFLIEGTTIDASLKESPYDRFPKSYKEKVRKPVWNLSRNSAGISIRFFSDSPIIKVKWKLLNNSEMNHMAYTGIKGIDLYYNSDDGWKYINTARPEEEENEFKLIDGMTREMREFKMYLPLYDGVVNLEVGIDPSTVLKKPAQHPKKPIVFYGTSITQGGCASRPGMVYSSIISRKMDVDCINFGFSGNGRMEKPVAEVIAGIDASFYVIDCVPNMKSPEMIHENMIPMVKILREQQPDIPILFVESVLFMKSFVNESYQTGIEGKNEALREEYNKLKEMGYKNLYYTGVEGAIGDDQEGTVDGVHFTDLGFLRFADYLIAKFGELGLIVTE